MPDFATKTPAPAVAGRQRPARPRTDEQGAVQTGGRPATHGLALPLQPPPGDGGQPVQRVANRTGLPAPLKAGIESLSGLSLDDVRVHRNSAAPKAMGALAFTRGNAIHVAPGQDHHLAHEAWHVVQQKRGQVSPTGRVGGQALNDDPHLEREAEEMGARAGRTGPAIQAKAAPAAIAPMPAGREAVVQRVPLSHEDIKDKSTAELETLFEQLRGHIARILDDEAKKGRTPEAQENAFKLIRESIIPSLTQGWTAEVYGYIRELTMMSSLSESGRDAVGGKSKTMGSHADVTWMSPTAGPFAAQMKTMGTFSPEALKKNLVYASDQLTGKTGEAPAKDAVLIADIATEEPIKADKLDGVVAQASEAIKAANAEHELAAHSIRLRLAVQEGPSVVGEVVISFARDGRILYQPPGPNQGMRPLSKETAPGLTLGADAPASHPHGGTPTSLRDLVRDLQTVYRALEGKQLLEPKAKPVKQGLALEGEAREKYIAEQKEAARLRKLQQKAGRQGKKEEKNEDDGV